MSHYCYPMVGHWNIPGDGCSNDSTPSVYSALSRIAECQPVMKKMKYFMGHVHCNAVTSKDLGFLIGGQGKSQENTCNPIFGFNVVDTFNDEVAVYYFPIAEILSNSSTIDNFDAINDCFLKNGVSGCYELAEKWSLQSFPL